MNTVIDYQTIAGRTDEISYKAANEGYYFAGGSEEASEILEKASVLYESNTKEDNKGIAHELGDRMWYAVRNIFSLCGCTPLKSMQTIDWLDEHCSATTAPVKYSYTSLPKVVNDIVILSGRINGLRKRMLRDNGGKWTAARIQEVCDMEIKVIERIIVAAHCAGYTFREVLEMNVAKLASRQLRGTISGCGDER